MSASYIFTFVIPGAARNLLLNIMCEEIFLVMHNLCNIALLPRKNNISKGEKLFNMITDPWLKKEISRMADISEKDFDKYSNLKTLAT
jgi:hypothetical protein